MAELIMKNLCKRYIKNKKQVHAVRSLNLICRDGEFVALLGPSGCGKSTTLRMIAGLDDVSSGDIMIGGKSVSGLHPSRRNVGLAFENYALYPPLTVYENIAFNLRARKISEIQMKQEVIRIAELLRIPDLLLMKPSALSGGQKQRVNLARAIVRHPEVLLLDEPLSHLDGKMRQTMRTEIKRLHSEMKTTSIIVTHDQSEAMALADRIAIMNEGVLQQYGTPMEVYNYPVNEFVAGFIGEPPMNLFLVNTVQLHDKLQFRIENTELVFPVPEQYVRRVRVGEIYHLGIRPTDICLVDGDSPCTLSAHVSIFEPLGEENRIHIRIRDQMLTLITIQGTAYRPGDKIRLLFREDRIHLFDLLSGSRIGSQSSR
jgi:multiple sugar transport system ATP-binding protein